MGVLHDAATDELVTVTFRGPDAESYAHARVPLRDRTITTIVFHQRQPPCVADGVYGTSRVCPMAAKLPSLTRGEGCR